MFIGKLVFIKLCFKITVDSTATVWNNILFHVTFTQVSPVVTSCIAIGKHHNQETDINTTHHLIQIYPALCALICVYVCVCVSSMQFQHMWGLHYHTIVKTQNSSIPTAFLVLVLPFYDNTYLLPLLLLSLTSGNY